MKYKPEIAEKIQNFESIVRKWSRKFSLISPWGLTVLQTVFIKPSIEMVGLMNSKYKISPESDYSILDIGSGAGFPGIIIALNGYKITLVESNEKRSAFLQYVIAELKLDNAKVLNQRIEKFQPDEEAKYILVSRATAEVKHMLDLTNHIRLSMLMLVKGSKVMEEIEYAQNFYSFDYNIDHLPSKVNILILDNCKFIR